jgi:hypothetical protein
MSHIKIFTIGFTKKMAEEFFTRLIRSNEPVIRRTAHHTHYDDA